MSSFGIAQTLDLPELPRHMAELEHMLAKTLTIKNPEPAGPIADLLKARGKRLRPALVLAIVICNGKKIDESIMAAAAAVELLHLASLVHDDIIDNAKTRHDLPTANAKAGVNRAIILGDFLLAKAFEQAAIAGQTVAQTLADAFTRTCAGQALELADLHNLNRSKASYFNSIRYKTGALFSAACQSGGILAKLNHPQIKALGDYGENFGVAFQLLDDVIDFISTPKLAGKPVGMDAPSGNYTLSLILALNSPLEGKYKKIVSKKSPQLSKNLLDDNFIHQTVNEIKRYNKSASEDLAIFGNQVVKLQSFPDAYLNWALKNLSSGQIN